MGGDGPPNRKRAKGYGRHAVGKFQADGTFCMQNVYGEQSDRRNRKSISPGLSFNGENLRSAESREC